MAREAKKYGIVRRVPRPMQQHGVEGHEAKHQVRQIVNASLARHLELLFGRQCIETPNARRIDMFEHPRHRVRA